MGKGWSQGDRPDSKESTWRGAQKCQDRHGQILHSGEAPEESVTMPAGVMGHSEKLQKNQYSENEANLKLYE